MTKRIEYIIDEILDQYMYADLTFRPWIIGFSGGKDSTVLLTLVWLALRKIKEQTVVPFQLRRPVYVVCNDTMVQIFLDDVPMTRVRLAETSQCLALQFSDSSAELFIRA